MINKISIDYSISRNMIKMVNEKELNILWKKDRRLLNLIEDGDYTNV